MHWAEARVTKARAEMSLKCIFRVVLISTYRKLLYGGVHVVIDIVKLPRLYIIRQNLLKNIRDYRLTTLGANMSYV